MKTIDLKNARVVGFFSLPSPSLGETNPEAYSRAMRDIPASSGSCHHCGAGILHHVIVETLDGKRHFIGSDCAQRIGVADSDSIRRKLTTVQMEAKAARQQAQLDAYWARENAAKAARESKAAVRRARFPGVFEALESAQTTFHTSLGAQLACGPLSEGQAFYAVKATLGRRNKANADEFDALQKSLCDTAT